MPNRKQEKLMQKIIALFLPAILCTLLAQPVRAQDTSESCVLEQQDKSRVASRIDWLSIAKCSEVATAGFGLQSIAGPMTFAQAAALVDAMRVNFGTEAPGEQDRFHKHCDHNYTVWKRLDGITPAKAFTRADGNPGLGFVLDASNLCCEDAAALTFPATTGANDCRTFDLMSVPGARVTLQNGHWVSIAGPVTIPGNPPITLASSSGTTTAAAGGAWAGTYPGSCTYQDKSNNINTTAAITFVITQLTPQTLRLAAVGSPEPVDLTLTSDLTSARGVLSKHTGNAAMGGAADMQYTATLQGDSLAVTMAGVTEGHANIEAMHAQNTGNVTMTCKLQKSQ
jgi:hypothetical protein